MAIFSTIDLSDLAGWRLDAEYYEPRNRELASKLSATNPVAVSTIAALVTDGIHASPEWTDTGGIRYLSAKCVRENRFDLSDAGRITEEQNGRHPRSQLQAGDVLVTTVGTIGVAAVVTADMLPANIDRHVGLIRLRDSSVSPYYLATFLNGRFGRFQSLREATGNVQLNLFIEKLRELRVPTGAAYNAIGARARMACDAARQADEVYPTVEGEMLDRLGWSGRSQADELYWTGTLSALMSAQRIDAECAHPKGERLRELIRRGGGMRLGEMSIQHARGVQPEAYSDEGGVVVVKSKNVSSAGIDVDSCDRAVADAWSLMENGRLSEGDLVVNSTGLGTLGRAGVIPSFSVEKLFAAVDLTIVNVDRTKACPEYVALFLNSPAGMLQSDMLQTGSSGQRHLYWKHIRELEVFLPALSSGRADLKWQHKLADRIVEARAERMAAFRQLDDAKAAVEELIERRAQTQRGAQVG